VVSLVGDILVVISSILLGFEVKGVALFLPFLASVIRLSQFDPDPDIRPSVSEGNSPQKSLLVTPTHGWSLFQGYS
jgi:hypothetical protein